MKSVKIQGSGILKVRSYLGRLRFTTPVVVKRGLDMIGFVCFESIACCSGAGDKSRIKRPSNF
jgi:hypothetical protein